MAAPSDAALEALARRLGRALLVKSWRVSTAESCTGGWVAKALTDVPGTAQWFNGGVVTYANEAKQKLLGVPSTLLEMNGAVSEPVVAAMAEGARERLGTELAVAISGVAGPDGGTPEKPVGTVWFAWAAEGGTATERRQFPGSRDAVRRASVAHALEGLLARVWTDDAEQ